MSSPAPSHDVRTMAGHFDQVFGRMAKVTDTPAFDDRQLMSDLSDRLELGLRQIGDGER